MLYRLQLGIALSAAAIALLFFAEGLSDGSMSTFNATAWLGVLAGTLGIPAAGIVLRRNGRLGAANLVLALLAVPALLAGMFFLVLILAQPRWN